MAWPILGRGYDAATNPARAETTPRLAPHPIPAPTFVMQGLNERRAALGDAHGLPSNELALPATGTLQ